MRRLKRKIEKMIKRLIDRMTGNGLMQEELEAEGSERYITPGMPELLRHAGAEGCVLLKNDGNVISENLNVIVTHVNTANLYRALGYVVKTGNKLYES